MRWRLVLEYDGEGFAGWQSQPDARTVQDVLEEALRTLFAEAIRVRPGGRTDAGVHAMAQLVAFDADKPRTPEKVRDALNALLPDDVSVLEAEPAHPDFDPRHCIDDKLYRYAYLDRVAPSPLRRRRTWHVRGPLDVDAMHDAVQALVGRHDFSSFRASGCTASHPVRIVRAAEVRRSGDEVHLDVGGHGFLRHMVRIVAGTALAIGQGRKPVRWMAEVLEGRDRTSAGMTAPARGLTLRAVTWLDRPPERTPLS